MLHQRQSEVITDQCCSLCFVLFLAAVVAAVGLTVLFFLLHLLMLF